MSNSILILGESGTGKSTSVRTLPPEETFVLNVIDKPLPFKGSRSKYKKYNPETDEGNYHSTDNPDKIISICKFVSEKLPHIKYLVIDDFGYTITNSFMRSALIKGYDKFSELGLSTFRVLEAIQHLRDDLFIFVMMHTEADIHGKYKAKTIGKMIDQYVVIEGKFTFVFHALTNDNQYYFLTNNDGQHMAKTPMGMFTELKIDNDLNLIANKINEYYEDE